MNQLSWCLGQGHGNSWNLTFSSLKLHSVFLEHCMIVFEIGTCGLEAGIYTQNPKSELPAQIRDLMGKWEALKRALDQLEKTHISEEIHKVFVKCKVGRVQTLEDLRLILHEHNIPEWLISISKSWWVFQWDNYYLDMMCNYHLTSTKTEMEACGEQPSHAFLHREVK